MQQKFDVFLNFRGEDVRRGFLTFLGGLLLNQTSLQIFVDSKMTKGDEISPTLMSAIENSKLAITIFSKSYAASPWCLNELAKIIECTEHPRIRQKVIPVFYLVTSAEVKSQSGSFTEAFTDHENSENLENRRKVPIWKAAMKRAGDFPGISVREKSDEYDVVVDIVNDVLKALGRPTLENKVDGSYNSVRLVQTLELQVKGNIWTSPSSTSESIRIDPHSLLNVLNLHSHPSSSLPLEWNPQKNSSYSQALTHVQTEGSTEWKPQTNSSNNQALTHVQTEGSTEWKPQTNSSNSQAPKYGQSEGSKSTETSSGPATEWKSKASTYGQSEGCKRTGTSSASVQNTSYLTTEKLYLPYARDKVVLFVKSSGLIKVIAEHCDAVRKMLKGYGVSFDERDTSVTSHRNELQDVLKGKPMKLPALFVKGDFIGGYEEVKKFKESGELADILQDFSVHNRTSSYEHLDHKSKKETETRPFSNSKGVSNTDSGMVKLEGSKIDANVSTTPWSYTPSNQVLSSSSLLSGAEDKIVLYFTSSEVSKRTYDDCREVRKIFMALRVLVDERNTNAVPDYTKELKNVLKEKFSLPQVFIRGKHIGGADEIREMNKTGKLKKLVEGFPVRNRPWYCDVCGDFRRVCLTAFQLFCGCLT